jgi:hypothetical protein
MYECPNCRFPMEDDDKICDRCGWRPRGFGKKIRDGCDNLCIIIIIIWGISYLISLIIH